RSVKLAPLEVRRTDVKHILIVGAALITTSTGAQANPWDQVPTTAPYKNLADSLQATSKPGQASPLNPSCEGQTGDACVRAEKLTDSDAKPKPTPKPSSRPQH